MNNFRLSNSSDQRLRTCDETLQRVVRIAFNLTDVDFSVIEGLRTLERQEELYAAGKSWTLNSHHLTGRAVDLYPWVNGATSHDQEHYKRVAKAMFAAACQLGVPVEWGGFWDVSNLDMPHWQLSGQ